MTNHPTILATYQPQAWVNDYATDIDGAFTYDVTTQVLDQAIAHGWTWVKNNLTDYSDTAEFNLWELTNERTDHQGPFVILVESAILDYLDAFADANGREMTDMDATARRDALRAAETAAPAEAAPETNDEPTTYRVCVTYNATTQAEADTLALAIAEALRTHTTFNHPYRLGTPTPAA